MKAVVDNAFRLLSGRATNSERPGPAPAGATHVMTGILRKTWHIGARRVLLCLAVMLAAVAAVPPAGLAAEVQSFVDSVREETEWFSSFPTRVVGMRPTDEQHRDVVFEQLLAKVEAVPGVRIWTQSFKLVMPQVLKAELTIDGGRFEGQHRIYPIWPACGRLNTTPEDGISGRLVYIGEGSPGKLPAHLPAILDGRIAVMEISGRRNWMAAYNAGAAAFLILGSPAMTQPDAEAQLMGIPVNVPRFYVPDGELADALRSGEAAQGRLYCKAKWAEVTATNIYALINPAERSKELENQQAFVIGVPYDSMSVIPELAPGADGAVDVAVALNLLRYFAEHPTIRPVLFAFTDAYAVNQRGVREMLGAFAGVPKDSEDHLKDDKKTVEEYRLHEKLASELHPETDAPVTREALNQLHLNRYRDLRRYYKDEVSRQIVAIESAMYPARAQMYTLEDLIKRLNEELETKEKELGAAQPGLDEIRERIKTLDEQHERARGVADDLKMMRGVYFGAQNQLLTSAPIRDKYLDVIRALWGRARKRIAEQVQGAEHRLGAYIQRDALRLQLLSALELAGQTERPLGFVFGLDVSDAGVAVGPCLSGTFQGQNETQNSQSFTRWLKIGVKEDRNQFWPDGLERAVDLTPVTGTEAVSSDVVGKTNNFSGMTSSFATAGVTWSTLSAARLRVDTPNDRADRLDWERLGPQIEATFVLLKRVLNDASFLPSTKSPARWSRVRGVVVDQSPGEPVPRVPMRGYLTTLVPGWVGPDGGGVWFWPVPGVRRQEFTFTRIDGTFEFDLMPSYSRVRSFYVQAYQFGPDGRITRAIDMLKAGRGVTLSTYTGNVNPGPMRAVVFDCAELTGLDFFDPRFLLALPSCTVMDAERGSQPQRMNLSRYWGMIACLLEDNVRWQLILRHGITSNSMVLLNIGDVSGEKWADAPIRDVMRGIRVGERPPLYPVHLAARDFYRLDYRRLRDYEKAGITSKHIENLQRRTDALLKQATEALEEDDGAAYHKATSGALANEVRVYQAVRDTANDVMQGAIFLLLVLVPFAFVLERLLFASPHIYKQLGAIIGAFAVMAAVLWSFHPAFRISGQPLMIIMAFGAIGMSGMVISMIFSKFEQQLEELRSGRAEASGARTSRLGLAYTAVRLGIANMRKRKLRTALTGITIILITFVLLCFMSTSNYSLQKEESRGMRAPFTGVMVCLPGTRPMSFEAVSALQNVVPKGRSVVPHYWWVSHDTQWRIHIRNPETGKQLSLKAGLGLVGEEGALSHLDELCPNWERFGAGKGCYLAADTARELGVEVGDKVVVAGLSLELLGALDPETFAANARRLDGLEILPYDFTSAGDEQRRQQSRSNIDDLMVDMKEGGGLVQDKEFPHASLRDAVIVHVSVLDPIPEKSLRSVTVPAESQDEAKNLADELKDRLALQIYYGSPEGGLHVIRSTLPVPSPPKGILIPLVVAGLIILNTMLSSIAERKREIYIYTSLGLAPLHVGFLFLAEAVTYGLMGSVMGYVVGQGVAKALTEFGLMGGVTLNYSGVQAIITMLLVLGVVIVSSLVPAFLAGKLATPSNEMTWKVPRPDGDIIRDRLPFTATPKTAGGVLAFLYEYMDAHREGSIGVFSADNLRTFETEGPDGRVLGLEGTVWLAPYDLGIRQDIRIIIHPAAEAGIEEIDVELHRRSGQVSSWWKLNRVLLGDLRKQLLGWRKLKMDRMLEYIMRAAEQGAPLQAQQR